MDKVKIAVVVALCVIMLVSCDGDDGGGGYLIAEYYPLGQGDTWNYGWNASPIAKTYDGLWRVTVIGTEIINGIEAVKFQYNDKEYDLWTNTNGTVLYKFVRSWGQRVYTPPLMLIPANVSIGTRHSFSSSVAFTDFEENVSSTESFSGETIVEGVEDVTVPAGTFSKCLKIKSTKTYIYSDGGLAIGESTEWLAKGVGKVMETWQWQYSWGDREGGTNELVYATVGGKNYTGSSTKGIEGVENSFGPITPRFTPGSKGMNEPRTHGK